MKLKYLLIFILSISLHASTYYISNTGNDSTGDGSLGNPWLSLQKAVNNVTCGDTINIVANGSFIPGDANLPQFPCSAPITVQSSKLNLFNPVGFRTNPVNDINNYGKLAFTGQGIAMQPSVWSFNPYGNWQQVAFNTSTDVVTLGSSFVFLSMTNGTQIEFEPYAQGSTHTVSLVPPSGISFLTHYYVINCSVSCGAQGSTFKLSLTSGGSPISLGTCGPPGCFNTVTSDPAGACSPNLQSQWDVNNNNYFQCTAGTWTLVDGRKSNIRLGIPVAASTVTSQLTLVHSYGLSLTNGMVVGFSSSGYNSPQGVVPTPLIVGAPYYVINLNGSSFQVALTAGGSPITLTGPGTGMVNISSFDEPSNWHFRGLEFAPDNTHVPGTFLVLGNAGEVSITGMTSNNEVDRCYMHDNPSTLAITHAIYENGGSLSIHDSWIIGANLSEAQAIGGVVSPGPTLISNNFLEATSEVTIYGGAWGASGLPNSNKLFIGNYFYKPPIWKLTVGAVVPSGACLYDATDPTHLGGEFYTNVSSGLSYQCPMTGIWGNTPTSLPSYGAGCSTNQMCIKDMTEHKNGRYFSYIGNVYNYSFSQDQTGQIFNNSVEWGSGPQASNDHITIMNNAAYNSWVWNTRTSQCDPLVGTCPNAPGVHTTINNLMVVNGLACGTAMSPSCPSFNEPQMATTANDDSGPNYFADDYWNHNTFWFPDSYVFGEISFLAKDPTSGIQCPPYSTTVAVRVIWFNTLSAGDFRTPCNGGPGGLTDVFTHSVFSSNAFKDAPIFGAYNNGNVGATNTWTGVGTGWPTTNANMGFPLATTGLFSDDYHLLTTSPFSADNAGATQLSSDLTSLGADIDVIMMAKYGATNGTPPLDQVTNLKKSLGSTKMVFYLNTPGTGVCTAYIYNAAPRITANLVTSVADSTANAISNGSWREIPITGLSASTQYWFKIDCGGNIVIVGTFTTFSSGGGSYSFLQSYSSTQNLTICTDKAMITGCSTQNSTSPVVVPTNTIRYWEVTPSASIPQTISILVAP